MFRGASLNTQPIEEEPTADRWGSFVPWYWPTGARVLLAGLAMAIALVLTSASRDGPPSEPIARAPELVLDPNTAPAKALAALPHIGPALAGRLVEARTERPFASLDDLRDRVRGVGPVTLAQIAPYLQIDLPLGFKPETLIASQGRKPARKSKSSTRKTVRVAKPIADTPRLAAIEQSSEPRRIILPDR
ncbi:MAG: ComEA family DNA-binding protein [Isosphaeraceae bacterium]